MRVLEPKPEAGRSGRPRIGVIAPASDLLIERDFWRMGLAADVDIFTTRIPLKMPLTPTTLNALANGIAPALERLLPEEKLDAVVFGCTSGSAIIGPDEINERIRSLRTGLQATNPITAAAAAYEALGVRKIAFLAPYSAEVAIETAHAVAGQGLTVVDKMCFGLNTDSDIAKPGPHAYLAAVREMNLLDAEAIFVSCTTSRAVEAIDPLEQATGLPVVTSNQAAFWHALALLGRRPAIEGFGQLLAKSAFQISKDPTS